MSPSRPNSPVDQHLVLKLIRQDMTHRSIADRLGVSRARISQIAGSNSHSAPVARRQRDIHKNIASQPDEETILAELLKGASRSAAATTLGITYYAVEKVAIKFRAEYPIISAPKRGRTPPRATIPIPAWVRRAGLISDYYDTALLFDEFAAARLCRALKREAEADLRAA